MSSVLLEARAFRPFKSSEEYLYAMKEDLAEWLQLMYPHLNIFVENFMEKLETGVALCEHANAVKAQAMEYVEKKQARMSMTKSITGAMLEAQQFMYIPDIKYFTTAKAGTFFARDNVSNFINWCRNSLKIIECLLFESDDLIMRKNEKHVILCLLEVARRGARFGMLAPMLVQMERQIDREIAADQRKLGFTDNDTIHQALEDDDSDLEDEEPVMMYGPVPQIITNDLKSLDEMVRDLVEKCTCPTQFPMIRVSEGKYRIGDTKVLIFVRILRKHVMVRVGGGWDTLSHYLDKHDPCRCKAQHRPTLSANLVRGNNKPDLHGAQVYYDRTNASPASLPPTINGTGSAHHTLGPPMNSLNRSRSRSPSHANGYNIDTRRSVSPNFPRKNLAPPPNRSRSPTPNYTSTHVTRLSSNNNRSPQHKVNFNKDNQLSGPQSLPFIPSTSPPSKHVSNLQIPVESKMVKTEASLHVSDGTDHSDTTSEMSDEGYRSLGIVQDKNKKRSSVYSQNSAEDVEENEHQQVYTDDELNDCGLRKTQFSQRIYDPDCKPVRKSSPEPKISLADLKPSLSLEKHPSPTSESPRHSLSHAESKLNGHDGKTNLYTEVDRSARSVKTPQLKERSFSEDRPSLRRRASSTELRSDNHKTFTQSPKKTLNGMSKTPKQNGVDSRNGTWNGRPKTSRPSLTHDTFTSPFQRNTNGRRSVSAVSERRSSSSANTSPTKSRLKVELLNAVKRADDDETIALQVQQLLKKYGSLSTLDNEENYNSPPPKPFTRQTAERVSYRSPRKDSRPEIASRIPAPKFAA